MSDLSQVDGPLNLIVVEQATHDQPQAPCLGHRAAVDALRRQVQRKCALGGSSTGTRQPAAGAVDPSGLPAARRSAESRPGQGGRICSISPLSLQLLTALDGAWEHCCATLRFEFDAGDHYGGNGDGLLARRWRGGSRWRANASMVESIRGWASPVSNGQPFRSCVAP